MGQETSKRGLLPKFPFTLLRLCVLHCDDDELVGEVRLGHFIRFLTLRGDGNAGDDHIVLALIEACENAVEGGVDKLDLKAEQLTNLFCHINVKALIHKAAVVGVLKRRITGLKANS